LIASSQKLHTTFQRCISKQRSPTKQHKHYTNQIINGSHHLQFLRFQLSPHIITPTITIYRTIFMYSAQCALSENVFSFLLNISSFFKFFKRFGKINLCGNISRLICGLLWEFCLFLDLYKGKSNVSIFVIVAKTYKWLTAQWCW
jgi:hypothetical protein